METLTTQGLSLDIVLLGSRLAVGPLEIALLPVLGLLWLISGVWLRRRASIPARRGPLGVFYGLSAAGLATAVVAQDAPLFYTGLAAAGYASLAALLLAHGPGHSRTATAQVLLLVLGDLILFELLVYLYDGAQSARFGALRGAYGDKADGLSFVGALLVATGATRIAVLMLLFPLSGRLPAWRMGAAPVLLATALAAGPLVVARLVDPALATPAAWYVLLAMAGAAVLFYGLAFTCILAEAWINGCKQWLSDTGSRGIATGVAATERTGQLSRWLAPRLQAAEQTLLSWPVAVAVASVFAVLLALAFLGAGGSG